MRVFSPSPEKLHATASHCMFAFATLEAHYSGGPNPNSHFEAAECPLFVTWNTNNGSGSNNASPWRLRGCIGTLEPRPLRTALRDFTLAAALRDSRFSPIAAAELPSLRVTVSLLSCFKTAAAWDAWEVGVHGLIIEFTDPDTQTRRSATFLPEVAHEQGWSRAECVDALIRKAGYTRKVTAALRSSLEVVTYESTTCSLTHVEYLALLAGEAQLAGVTSPVGMVMGGGRRTSGAGVARAAAEDEDAGLEVTDEGRRRTAVRVAA